MQMYQVEFQTHYENLIDVGTVIVCAGSSEAARDTVIALLELPSSRTVTNITRIKPSFSRFRAKRLRAIAKSPFQRMTLTIANSANAIRLPNASTYRCPPKSSRVVKNMRCENSCKPCRNATANMALP